MISGRKAIHEALVAKSVAFADRPEFYIHVLTNPRTKGRPTSLVMTARIGPKPRFIGDLLTGLDKIR